MKRVLVLVEGSTEAFFVRSVLYEHLIARDLLLIPTIIETGRRRVGPTFKGGVSTWSKLEPELRELLRDSGATAVTTLIDYYGVPKDVPGMSDRPRGSAFESVTHVERAIEAHFRDPRLRPHLILHEFEAMMFADLDAWAHRFHPAAIDRLRDDVGQLAPEDINESPEGAPSRRIQRRIAAYAKPIHGPLAAQDIGLAAIRARCPHFGAWLTWLESVGSPA